MRDTTASVGGEAAYLYANKIKSNHTHGELNDSQEKMNYGYGMQDAMIRAAQLGWQPAMETLAQWYETGTYLSKNLVKAKEWKEKAGITEEEIEADESDEVFDNPEVAASFPGGNDAFMEWLKANKRDLGNANGTVRVSFVVEKDGTISDADIVERSGTPEHNREALRLVMSMPKFTPAKNGDKAVRSRKVLRIKFYLMQG